MEEIESDVEDDPDRLLAYYLACNNRGKAVVNNVMIYLCGWSFKTLLEKCGIEIDESGEPTVHHHCDGRKQGSYPWEGGESVTNRFFSVDKDRINELW